MKALRFGAATSDRLDCGAAANITGFTKFSGGALLKITTLTDGRQLCTKTNSASVGWGVGITGTTGNARILFNGATLMTYDTNSTPLKLNRWQFVAWVIDTSLGAGLKAHVYASPSLDSAMVEATYAAFAEGSAPAVDTTSQPFVWGNNSAAPSLAMQGSMALGFHAPNVTLSLGELKQWQMFPFAPPRGTRLFTIMGHNGRGLVRDWSQVGGHTGTITGAVAAEGPVGYHPTLPFKLLRTFVAGPQATDDVLIRVGNMSLTEHSGLVTPLFTATSLPVGGGIYRRRRLSAFVDAD